MLHKCPNWTLWGAIELKAKNWGLEYKNNQTQAYLNPELGAEAKERGNVPSKRANDIFAIRLGGIDLDREGLELIIYLSSW